MSQRLVTEVSGQGPDLVLVHGWGMNSGVWSSLLPALAERYTVTRVDLPGHGRSPGIEDNSLAGWATAVADVTPRGAAWLAWSLGGLITQQVLLANPQHVGAAVLVCSTPRFTATDDWPHAVSADVLLMFAAELGRDSNGAWQRFLALTLRGSEEARNLQRQLKERLMARGAPQPEALAAGLELLRDSDLRSRIGNVQVPLRLVFGERDTLVPVAVAADIAECVPGARVDCIAGTGHAPFLTHAGEILDVIDDEVHGHGR